MLITASLGVVFVVAAFLLVDVWNALIQFTKEQLYFVTDDVSDYLAVQGIIATIITIVYLLWLVPNIKDELFEYFVVSKDSNPMSLLFTAFSHNSFPHAFTNLYALTNCCKEWESYVEESSDEAEKQLMSASKLFAFYLSAGFAANTGSRIIQIIGNFSYGSLGASGAIYGMIGYMSCKEPHKQMSLIFLPFFSFSAVNGVVLLGTLDTMGLLYGIITNWRNMFLDHGAHLTGLLFGIWYANYGEDLLD